MIKAQDLRIGNLIKYAESDDIFLVYEISPSGFWVRNKKENTWIEDWQFEGIPITEEWLLKLGFLRIQERYGCHFENKKCWVYLLQDCFEIEWITQDERFNFCRSWYYVHNLQNIHYSLTGEELCLNSK
jgi:hypothetical protein